MVRGCLNYCYPLLVERGCIIARSNARNKDDTGHYESEKFQCGKGMPSGLLKENQKSHLVASRKEEILLLLGKVKHLSRAAEVSIYLLKN